MNYTASKLAEITKSELIGEPTTLVKAIIFDSRIIYSAQATAFIAINTKKNNGEKYIASAIEKGIKIIISEKKIETNEPITWILVEDSLRFLQQLAQQHFIQFPQLKSIGITGSNGKTIVKEWLYQSICDDFRTVKSPKSFNSQLGLPLSLLQIETEHQIGVFEVGISQEGEMEKLEQIFNPKIGVLTHIGSAHLANFKDEEKLVDEKLKLFKHSVLIIYNGDNELVCSKMNQLYPNKQKISFGLKKENGLHICSEVEDKNQAISFSYFGEIFQLNIKQRDPATLSNVLCIVAILKVLGYENQQIQCKLDQLRAIEMRLESVNGIHNNLIINDSFNLDLDSLVTAYQFIKEYKKDYKTLIITDFVEEKNNEALYSKVVELTNEQKFNKIFLIGNEITKYRSYFQSETFVYENTEQLLSSNEIHSIEHSLILIKGARKFETEQVKYYFELQKHDSILEIDLNAILHNVNYHKSLLKPSTKMMAMVKAHAYGLGGYEIAEFLQHHHIDYLGVAYADEGMELRKNGITTPIMVMNPEQNSYKSIIEYQLEPEIYSFRVLKLFLEQLKRTAPQQKYPIHIKLETGMHRLGFKEVDLESLAHQLNEQNIEVISIFSHLATSDDINDKHYALEQFECFENLSQILISNLGYQPIRHILNSSGIVNFSAYQYDMVRIGIGMLGVSPNPKIKKHLQSAVRFKTVVSQISEIKKGESVGYSRRFISEKDTKVATIPVGYADGIPRLVGNGKASFGINGTLVPVVGNLCMDMLMLDIGNLPVKEGDEVVIFNSKPSLEDFAKQCETIAYEVLTSISRRIKRIYIKN